MYKFSGRRARDWVGFKGGAGLFAADRLAAGDQGHKSIQRQPTSVSNARRVTKLRPTTV